MKKRYIILFFLILFGLFLNFIIKKFQEPINNPVKNDLLLPKKEYPNKKDLISVNNLYSGDTISSPLIIKGKAVGNWFFEATAPIEIVNYKGDIIGNGYIQVDEGYDWMITEMVPFTGTIAFNFDNFGMYKNGKIILKKSNPSGEVKFDDSLEININFK